MLVKSKLNDIVITLHYAKMYIYARNSEYTSSVPKGFPQVVHKHERQYVFDFVNFQLSSSIGFLQLSHIA